MAGPADAAEADLGWRSQAILAEIHKRGGTSNTSQIRDDTGIQGGTKVPYRMKNKLAPAGLIEIDRQGVDENNQNPPMIATLTETGELLARRIAEAEDEDRLANMSDYAEQLEAKVNQLETRIDELEDGGSSAEQDTLAETVDQLTTGKYGAWNDEATQQFTELLYGMLALRSYLLEESSLTRNELDERKAEAQTAIEDA